MSRPLHGGGVPTLGMGSAIPPFNSRTGTLPPGIYDATWLEFASRYGTNAHRQNLLRGMHAALINLYLAGCGTVVIGGSFVTDKLNPSDFDGAADPRGVNRDLVDPVMLPADKFDRHKFDPMKKKYGGELYLSAWPAKNPEGLSLVDFFQFNTHKKIPVGVVRISLPTLFEQQ
jgi:hypothetical protein